MIDNLEGGVSLPTTMLTTMAAWTCMQARGLLLEEVMATTWVAPSRSESAPWNISGKLGAFLVGIAVIEVI